jgi:hypothetical protein
LGFVVLELRQCCDAVVYGRVFLFYCLLFFCCFRLWWFSCLFGGPFCFVGSIFASLLVALVSHSGDVVVVLWLRGGGGDSVVWAVFRCCFRVKVLMWWCVHEEFLFDLYRPAHLEITVVRVVVGVSNIR